MPKMIRPGERQGLLTLLYVDGGTMHFKCECGDRYPLNYKQRDSHAYGVHCGCLNANGKYGNGPAVPAGWTEFYGRDPALRTWHKFPAQDKCPYYDLVSTYSGIHEPTGKPLPPPAGMDLRDPEKPATFENIMVFYTDHLGYKRSFDGFRLSLSRWTGPAPHSEPEPPQKPEPFLPQPRHSHDSLDW